MGLDTQYASTTWWILSETHVKSCTKVPVPNYGVTVELSRAQARARKPGFGPENCRPEPERAQFWWARPRPEQPKPDQARDLGQPEVKPEPRCL